MSAKSSKPAKKLSVPRPLSEIQQEYQTNCLNAGQLQYQIGIYNKELQKVNDRLESINNEAAARKRLDDESSKSTEASTPAAEQQASHE